MRKSSQMSAYSGQTMEVLDICSNMEHNLSYQGHSAITMLHH